MTTLSLEDLKQVGRDQLADAVIKRFEGKFEPVVGFHVGQGWTITPMSEGMSTALDKDHPAHEALFIACRALAEAIEADGVLIVSASNFYTSTAAGNKLGDDLMKFVNRHGAAEAAKRGWFTLADAITVNIQTAEHVLTFSQNMRGSKPDGAVLEQSTKQSKFGGLAKMFGGGMKNPFPPIHCDCGEVWTQEMHTVCPRCAAWPPRKMREEL